MPRLDDEVDARPHKQYLEDFLIGMPLYRAQEFCTDVGFQVVMGYMMTRDYHPGRIYLREGYTVGTRADEPVIPYVIGFHIG